MIPLSLFIFGLIVGSFLNVVIFRLDKNKSFLGGRSVCLNCGKKIAWYDNLPLLSFVILGGRCRFCKKNISWQYPLVELATAIIFAWFYWQFGLSLKFFALIIFSCFLLVIFIYDLKHYLILDKVVIPAMVVALLFNLCLGLSFKDLILGGLIGGSFFAIQYYVSKGKWVGGGDIRLGILMGLMLGWKFLLVALFLAYLLGAGVGLVLIVLNKKKMSSQIPFGPFLVLATLITLVYGQHLISWYFSLLYG